MKKILATIICLIALTITAIPAGAQTRDYWPRRNSASTAQRRSYYDERYRDRSFWEKHRDKITTAGGVVGGAIIGGLLGGKKGAAVGAVTGGAGSAVYTYKIRNKDRRY